MKIFFLHNLEWFFHFWCQIEAVFNILTFSKWPPFKGRGEIFYRKIHRTLNMLQKYPWAFVTFWAFDRCSSLNIDRAIAVQTFELFGAVMTSSVMQSIINYMRIFTIQWYIYTLSMMMKSLVFVQLLRKKSFFIYKGISRDDFEVFLWHHQWRHHHENIFFLYNLGRSFNIWCQIEAALNIKKSK